MGTVVLLMGIGYFFCGNVFMIVPKYNARSYGRFVSSISILVCSIIMVAWTVAISKPYRDQLIYIGWLPHLILSIIPFLNGLIAFVIYTIITNLRSIGRLRHVKMHNSDRLAVVMQDERWRLVIGNIMSVWQLYHKQINQYKSVSLRLGKRLGRHWHRLKYRIKSGGFSIRYTNTDRVWENITTNEQKLKIYRRRCRLILSIEVINERSKVLYADLNYLPDWSIFPTIIEQATEQLHEQAEILQYKLDDRTYQQHQDRQGFEDYVSALADVFIDKT